MDYDNKDLHSVQFFITGSYGKQTVVIREENGKYSASSTNNMILCADCNRLLSVHSNACPYCGCVTQHTMRILFNRFIQQKKQAIDAEEKRRLLDHVHGLPVVFMKDDSFPRELYGGYVPLSRHDYAACHKDTPLHALEAIDRKYRMECRMKEFHPDFYRYADITLETMYQFLLIDSSKISDDYDSFRTQYKMLETKAGRMAREYYYKLRNQLLDAKRQSAVKCRACGKMIPSIEADLSGDICSNCRVTGMADLTEMMGYHGGGFNKNSQIYNMLSVGEIKRREINAASGFKRPEFSLPSLGSLSGEDYYTKKDDVTEPFTDPLEMPIHKDNIDNLIKERSVKKIEHFKRKLEEDLDAKARQKILFNIAVHSVVCGDRAEFNAFAVRYLKLKREQLQ